MIAAIPALVSGGTSIVQGVQSLINPGASRDKARAARLAVHESGALAGDVDSARRLINGEKTSASAESKMYAAAIERVRAAQPDTMAQAEKLGPLATGFGRADGTGWAQELESLRHDLEVRVSQTVQKAGAGLTTAAANGVTGGSSAVTIPTTRGTLVFLAVAVVALIVLFRRKG